jgi:glycosyltransferase involved in cell wall biosynthesis
LTRRRTEIAEGLRPLRIERLGRVSVVVPLYNHERYIAEAVESILAQGPIVREVVVIDDGPTDGSAARLAVLAARDARITTFLQDNRGAHKTINRGIQFTRGEFVTILNSDDAYVDGRLERLAEALDRDVGSDLAASSIAFMDANSRAIANPWHANALQAFKNLGDLGLALIDGNFLMTTSNCMMRRSLFDEIGYFAPLRYAHDFSACAGRPPISGEHPV